MSISFSSTGSFRNTEAFLNRMSRNDISSVLNKYGAIGTAALRSATPVESGATAASWSHKVSKSVRGWELSWDNQNGSGKTRVAILLQYGHGTGTGGYVVGRDYINPAIQPIFDQIATAVWREVTRK